MSLNARRRVWRECVDLLNQEEKDNQLSWCGITDELIKKKYPNVTDIDQIIDSMSKEDFRAFIEETLRLHRQRELARKKGLARYLRQERKDQEAEQVEEQIRQLEAEMTTAEATY